MAPAVNPVISEEHLNESAADLLERPDNKDDIRDVDFYNPHEGTKGRPGGVYLDMQERVDAEEIRAMAEGRDPDYDNPPAVAGTPLVSGERLVDNVYSNPSAVVAPVNETEPVSTLPVDFSTGDVEPETTKKSKKSE